MWVEKFRFLSVWTPTYLIEVDQVIGVLWILSFGVYRVLLLVKKMDDVLEGLIEILHCLNQG